MAVFASACILMGGGDGETNEEPLSAPGIESSFTLKRLRNTGANPFAQLAYECEHCSFAQHAAVEPPAGWTRAPAQVILPIDELESTPSVEGCEDSVDLIPEIPGARTPTRPGSCASQSRAGRRRDRRQEGSRSFSPSPP